VQLWVTVPVTLWCSPTGGKHPEIFCHYFDVNHRFLSIFSTNLRNFPSVPISLRIFNHYFMLHFLHQQICSCSFSHVSFSILAYINCLLNFEPVLIPGIKLSWILYIMHIRTNLTKWVKDFCNKNYKTLKNRIKEDTRNWKVSMLMD
jgi:hypothetical protein